MKTLSTLTSGIRYPFYSPPDLQMLLLTSYLEIFRVPTLACPVPVLENSFLPLSSAVLGSAKPLSSGPEALPVPHALALIFFVFSFIGI